jgi:hypothetical protein
MEYTRLHTVKVYDPNLGDKWLKRKNKNKSKYKTLKKYSSTKRNRIYHKRHINKKTYKNK